jgi:hypothetical protein
VKCCCNSTESSVVEGSSTLYWFYHVSYRRSSFVPPLISRYLQAYQNDRTDNLVAITDIVSLYCHAVRWFNVVVTPSAPKETQSVIKIVCGKVTDHLKTEAECLTKCRVGLAYHRHLSVSNSILVYRISEIFFWFQFFTAQSYCKLHLQNTY